MKKVIFTSIISLYFFATLALGTWQYVGVYGGMSCDATLYFTVGGKGYLGCGRTAFGVYKNDFWEFNPVTSVWIQKASFPGGVRGEPACFAVNNKGYAGLGFDGTSYFNDFWEYDPSNNQWSPLTPFPGSPRYSAIYFTLNNLCYIGTGYNGSLLSDFWQYNPTSNLWVQKATFPGPARQASKGFAVAGSGYLVGGYNNGTAYNDLWEYNPTTNQWIQKTSYPGNPRRAQAAFTIDTIAYVGMGYDNTNYHIDFFQYHPSSDQWIQESNFAGVERYLPFSFVINDTAYLGTGSYGPIQLPNFLADVWKFSIGTTAIEELSSNSINIWYSNGQLYISSTKSNKDDHVLIIRDLNGKILHVENLNLQNTIQTFNLPIQLKKGVYLFSIMASDSKYLIKKIYLY